jgi:cystathionine beta-lyase/cystathionine gamma-synthase
MMNDREPGIFTRSVMAGYFPQGDGAQPAVPPLVPSVGFVHPTMDETERALGISGKRGESTHVYARHGGPTQAAFEEAVASLEGAEAALSFSSGMAALHAALLAAVPTGGVVLAAEQLYGVTRTLLDWMAATMGLAVHYCDFLDANVIHETTQQVRPMAVLCEVLTNPLVRVVPLDAVAGAAREVGASLIVDNTFASPYLLRPLRYGAELVVHSTTKYLNGHGDVLGGVVAGPGDTIESAFAYRKLFGAAPGAFDSWLALRGLRTLALRMRQACEGAHQIARWLEGQDRVSRVFYPGLDHDPCHETAAALFEHDAFGAMLAFEVEGLDRAGAFAFVEHLRIIRPVTSLGDLYSLISHPATSSHRALTPEARAAQGIGEGTLRLSVGIEDPEDLIADLAGALDTIDKG